MNPYADTTTKGVWITEFKNTLFNDKSYGGTGKTTLFCEMLKMVIPTFALGSKTIDKNEFKMSEYQDEPHICFEETPSSPRFATEYKAFVDGNGVINKKNFK